jgi:hypothetical protein
LTHRKMSRADARPTESPTRLMINVLLKRLRPRKMMTRLCRNIVRDLAIEEAIRLPE